MSVAFAASPQNPLLDNNSLYVSHSGVHRFNLTSLELEWTSLEGVETFEPVIGEGKIFVGSTQGLYALDPVNGRILWHIEKSRTVFSPEISDQVYAGSIHGELYAIEPTGGNINWRTQFDGWIYSPVIMPDQGLLWTGGQAHIAFALSIRDGRQLHSLPLPQESIFSPREIGKQQVAFNLFNGDTAIINSDKAKIDGWLKGSSQPKNLQFDSEFVYRAGRDGSLSAFDRNNYKTKWQKPIVQQDLTLHPRQSGYLLMSDQDRSLVLFDLQTQAEKWRKQISGKWFLPIQIDDEKIIYFISSNMKPIQISAVIIFAQ